MLHETCQCERALEFTYSAVKWIKRNAGTLEEYEVNLMKTMLLMDTEKITLQRLKSVHFTATHEDEIEQVLHQVRY